MLDISAVAWAVLLPAWAVRWALIGGIGSAPWLTRQALRLLRRPMPAALAAHFSLFRQTCAFSACCLAIWSFQLAADTYLVESGNFSELTSKRCVRDAGADSLRCEDGTAYFGVSGQGSPAGRTGNLYLLPRSQIPVYFGD